MNITLKILLLSDAFFALALAVYLFIKYRRRFKRRTDIFKSEVAISEAEAEVTYEEEKVEVVTETVFKPSEEQSRTKSEKLKIGSYEELEALIKERLKEKVK